MLEVACFVDELVEALSVDVAALDEVAGLVDEEIVEVLSVDVAALVEVAGFVDVFSVVEDAAFENDLTVEVFMLDVRADELEDILTVEVLVLEVRADELE